MGSFKMENKLLMGKSTQCTNKKEEPSCKRDTAPQNITVILPAYNEEVSIGSIVLLTRFYADSVIVVDDGSADRTAEIAKRAGAEVIIHKINTGKGSALKTGFKAAAEMGADIIVTMDSDGQHNPADIPKLIVPIIEGNADIVNGSRYLNGMDKNTPIYRRVGQTILDSVTNVSSGVKITDSQSGFRAFAASTVNTFRFDAQGMGIESEMLADAGKAGLRIKEVEIGVRYDVDGSTLNPIQHGLEVFIMVLKDIEFNKPLYYLTVPGLSLGIGGLYIGAHFLQTFATGESIEFGSSVLMILLIVIGTFMALTGILLHSVLAVMRNAKGA
jgi:glycosyltransferase involved in cell wall biosynthesis